MTQPHIVIPSFDDVLLARYIKGLMDHCADQRVSIRVGDNGTETELTSGTIQAIRMLFEIFSVRGACGLQTYPSRLSVAQAAEYLGTSHRYVFQLMSDGTLPFDGATGIPTLSFDDVSTHRQILNQRREESSAASTEQSERWS